MRLLVLSDSHHIIRYMADVLAKIHKHIDGVLYLGDGCADLLWFESEYTQLFFHAVAGNCDDVPETAPFNLIVLQNKSILMTHGHRYNVRMGLNALGFLAREQQADICLFGHTHRPVITQEHDVLYMNPGSISRPRFGPYPTYGVIEITEKGDVYPAIVDVKL